jgi:hypothetical protein
MGGNALPHRPVVSPRVISPASRCLSQNFTVCEHCDRLKLRYGRLQPHGTCWLRGRTASNSSYPSWVHRSTAITSATSQSAHPRSNGNDVLKLNTNTVSSDSPGLELPDHSFSHLCTQRSEKPLDVNCQWETVFEELVIKTSQVNVSKDVSAPDPCLSDPPSVNLEPYRDELKKLIVRMKQELSNHSVICHKVYQVFWHLEHLWTSYWWNLADSFYSP